MNWFVCDDTMCNALTVKWQRDGSDTEKYPGNWGTGPEKHKHHLPNPDADTLLRFLIVPPGMKQRLPHPCVKTVYKELDQLTETVESIFFIGWSAPETDQEWTGKMFQKRRVKAFIINRDTDDKLLERYRAVLHPHCKVTRYSGASGDVSCYKQSEWWPRLVNRSAENTSRPSPHR
jgi:hypothetical protein